MTLRSEHKPATDCRDPAPSSGPPPRRLRSRSDTLVRLQHPAPAEHRQTPPPRGAAGTRVPPGTTAPLGGGRIDRGERCLASCGLRPQGLHAFSSAPSTFAALRRTSGSSDSATAVVVSWAYPVFASNAS